MIVLSDSIKIKCHSIKIKRIIVNICMITFPLEGYGAGGDCCDQLWSWWRLQPAE